MPVAVACMSGSFKGVFVHGVLAEFEAQGLRAASYACISSSTMPAAFAAIGAARSIGVEIWTESLTALDNPGTSMSDVVLASIRSLAPRLVTRLFAEDAARLLIGTSRVITEEGAAITQGPGAKRLGRKLLVEAARRDSSWPDHHLRPFLFDSRASDTECRMTAANFCEVAYATSRMMHAWPIPAWVDGRAHVDGSYTCLCPAGQMPAFGYTDVIAIATEPGPIYQSMFSDQSISATAPSARIRVVQPPMDLREIGVDFLTATPQGLERAFDIGRSRAREFLLRS